MESMLNEQEKQRAIEKFEKKQARLFPIGKGIVYAIVGWDIYTVVGMLLIEFMGISSLENVLPRGATWARSMEVLLNITGIKELLFSLMYDLPDEIRQSTFDVVNYFLPGFLCCLAGGVVIVSNIALLRGKTWGRIVRGVLAIASVIGAVGHVLWLIPSALNLVPGSLVLSIILLALELAVCYLLFFSKAVKEYTYIKGKQF